MKGYSRWQQTCDTLYHDKSQKREFFITQIIPSKDGFTVNFLDKKSSEHYLNYRERGSRKWLSSDNFTVCGLKTGTDYEVAACRRDGIMTEVRLVRPFEPIGTVVNYLHPEDPVYNTAGQFLASPSVCRLPSGKLLASMDIFARSSLQQNLTIIFESVDGGESWQYLTELHPCVWGHMFVHRGRLYMLGASCGFGDLLIGASDDEGKTWTTPTIIFRAADPRTEGWHKGAVPVVERDGMLYTCIEWNDDEFKSSMASCPADSDLLNPENWRVTEPLKLDETWEKIPQGQVVKLLEGNAVVAPDGSVFDFIRIDQYAATPNYGSAVLLKLDDRDKSLRFDRLVDFPLGSSAKFHITKINDTYLAAGNEPYDKTIPAARNLLSVAVSKDLLSWEIVERVVDGRAYDETVTAFQYPSITMSGDDLIILSRTGFDHAASGHDSNMITCHRVKNISKFLNNIRPQE